MVDKFTYLGSTISSKLSIDKEVDIQIGGAATLARFKMCIFKKNVHCLNTGVVKYLALPRPRYQCIMVVFLVHFYREASPGQHMLLKSVD